MTSFNSCFSFIYYKIVCGKWKNTNLQLYESRIFPFGGTVARSTLQSLNRKFAVMFERKSLENYRELRFRLVRGMRGNVLGRRAASVLTDILYWFLNPRPSFSTALLASIVSFGQSILSFHFLIRKSYLFIPLVPQQSCIILILPKSRLRQRTTCLSNNVPSFTQ